MGEPLRFGRSDGVGETFSVQRTVVALKLVSKAAEMDVLVLPFDENGQMTPAVAGQFVVLLNAQIAQAMKNQGSLTVRFLGDLKATVYPIDTHFFRINPTGGSEDDNFAAMLKKALLSGEKEDMTFINLANVRDVKIHVGNSHITNVSSDLSYLSRLADALQSWDRDLPPCNIVMTGEE